MLTQNFARLAIFGRSLRGSVNVRFAPKATEVLRCREASLVPQADVTPGEMSRMAVEATGRIPTVALEFGRRPSTPCNAGYSGTTIRSEEHTSELQSLRHLVCRLL